MAGENLWQTTRSWCFPASTASISRARNTVGAFVLTGPFAARYEDVRLMVSELVTNAIVHARSSCEVTVRQRARALRVEVSDASDAEPEPRRPELTEANGRGLLIVGSLAHAWSVDHHAAGKTVWFELVGDPAGDQLLGDQLGDQVRDT